jgi:hypothetical protein
VSESKFDPLERAEKALADADEQLAKLPEKERAAYQAALGPSRELLRTAVRARDPKSAEVALVEYFEVFKFAYRFTRAEEDE